MFVSTLLVKNWRIYRIFHNRLLQLRVMFDKSYFCMIILYQLSIIVQGSSLTDGVLVAEQLVVIIPVIIALIVMSATGLKFRGVEVQSEV